MTEKKLDTNWTDAADRFEKKLDEILELHERHGPSLKERKKNNERLLERLSTNDVQRRANKMMPCPRQTSTDKRFVRIHNKL
ncbi:hypothetical protein [Alteribacillus sp. HJP-4]|uniref:hypothetical protein n=1 Tax=Alteribacillus sp. HJP-4 TaxID=2775394 RepID=UPI0035CCF970